MRPTRRQLARDLLADAGLIVVLLIILFMLVSGVAFWLRALGAF